MKIVSVVGARPQFIKAAVVSKELRKKFQEVLIHTGQHYDPNMSEAFFEELEIPEPDYKLGVGSLSQGKQTGEMLVRLEEVLVKEHPDLVLVYGDTNSTLAGGLAAAKLHYPVAHVEAGLRSFNRSMAEEINRVLTDHLSALLFCPTETAVENLKKEGITKGVWKVGDVMFDSIINYKDLAERNSTILEKLALEEKNYLLATIHRAENTDSIKNLQNILEGFLQSGEKIVLPLHPRTKKALEDSETKIPENVLAIEPLGYLDLLKLEANAKKILTDSGGVQKEAYFLKIPCITLREETEWVETIEDGWNLLVGSDKEKIVEAIRNFQSRGGQKTSFGAGNASGLLVEKIKEFLEEARP
ncbi:MAG: UDP-N-acetylglucosamine 2-epimerase (non-hydrolyzing) [bacterium]|nr:UDP-N-acetylglucosamine 2-epimerase (non-hydrolyzing) [bacterium]